MMRSLTGALTLGAALTAAACSGPTSRGEPDEPDTGPVLRLALTNEAADAGGPRETSLDLALPAAWRTADTFSGGWTQPQSAPTLMLVASAFDDGRRSGTYEAYREGERLSVNLHPAFADNNITLSFTLSGPSEGAGQWGHSTFVGYTEKGPVRVSVVGE